MIFTRYLVVSLLCNFVSLMPAFAVDLSTTNPAIMQETIVLQSSPTTKQTKFSEALCNLQNVKEIRVIGHDVAMLPGCIANFSRTLRTIDVSKNKLSTLPPEVGSLSFLEKCNFSENQISSIPQQISNAKKISALNLSSNKITTLPDSLGEMVSLISLDLSNNTIAYLPDSFANLTSLEELDLRDNKITETPKFLPYLVNLRHLYLGNNQLSDAEKEVIKAIYKGPKADVPVF